jgi:ribosomal protein L28
MRQRILAAGKTEGALKGANHRTGPVGWKGKMAALAGRLHEEHGQEFQQKRKYDHNLQQTRLLSRTDGRFR